jgi:hypothetical protein
VLRRRGLVIVLLLALAGCSSSGGGGGESGTDQSSGETWSKSFGGPQDDQALAVAATRDGGFVFVGLADGHLGTSGDFWLNKLDASGNSELERVIGPRRTLSIPEGVMTFKRARGTPDGGFILIGYLSGGNPNHADIAVARLDSSGNVLWARSHDSGPWLNYEFSSSGSSRAAEARDYGDDIAVSDNGYWLIATSTADLRDTLGSGFPGVGTAAGVDFYDARSVVVMHLDADGNQLASRRLTDDAFENHDFRDYDPLIRATADGGAAIGRARIVEGQTWLTVQKFSQDATLAWTRQLEEIGRPTDLIQTDDVPASGARDGQRDDGFLFSGTNFASSGIVAKLTAAGDVEWQDVFNDLDDIDFTSYPRITINAITQRCSASLSGALCTYAIAGSYDEDEGVPARGYVVQLASDGSLIGERTIPEVSSVLRIDGGNDGAPLRALGYGDGDDWQSHQGTLLTLDAATLDTRDIHVLDLELDFNSPPALVNAGPLNFDVDAQQLVQLDATGVPTLQTVLREIGTRLDEAKAVVELAPGRYLIAGSTRSFSEIEAPGGPTREEAWVMRFDASVGVIWQRRLAPGTRGRVVAMTASSDGGALVGIQRSGALSVIKLDADGRMLWQSATAVGVDTNLPAPAELHATTDGGCVLVASTETSGSVVRLDSAGVLQWARTLGVRAQSIHPTADGGFVVAAESSSRSGLAVVVRLDTTGNLLWTYEYSFAGGYRFGPPRVRQARDGGYLLGLTEKGVTSDGRDERGNVISRGQSNVLLLKLDADGALRWSRSYGGLYDEQLTDLQALEDGGFVVAGWSNSLGDGREAWLLRLGPDGFVNSGSCNAYLGAVPATLFGARVPALRSTQLILAGESGPPASMAETSESMREATDHIVARQCLGPVTNLPDGPPPVVTSFSLALQFAGDGSGSVSSDPAGLDCTSGCSADFPAGRLVVLTPMAAADSVFAGWENCGTTDGDRCLILMNQAREVHARFDIPRGPSLDVLLVGEGSGVVTSNFAGIACGADCHEEYARSATIVLTAAPDNTSSFTGWSGCDSTDRDQCTVLVDRQRVVSAHFSRLPTGGPHDLRIEMDPASRGIGSITSSPTLVSCQVELTNVQPNTGGPCVYSVVAGSTYTIIATPEPFTTTTFVGWSGCDSTPAPLECQVTMNAPRTVTARFTAP